VHEFKRYSKLRPEVPRGQWTIDRTRKHLRKLRWIGKEVEALTIVEASDDQRLRPARPDRGERNPFPRQQAWPSPRSEFRKTRPLDPEQMSRILRGHRPTSSTAALGREYLTAILKSVRQCPLTEEQVFRLWRCAIKDDDNLIDTVIEKVYDKMVAFDPERADTVMRLIIERDEVAGPSFRTLLQDIETAAVDPKLAP
jgi:hypothetical protein